MRPRTVRKLGRDIEIGDWLRMKMGFLVLAFATVEVPDARLALNCWADGVVLHDDHEYEVLAPLGGSAPVRTQRALQLVRY